MVELKDRILKEIEMLGYYEIAEFARRGDNEDEGSLVGKYRKTYLEFDEAFQKLGHMKSSIARRKEGIAIGEIFHISGNFILTIPKVAGDIKYDLKDNTDDSPASKALQIGVTLYTLNSTPGRIDDLIAYIAAAHSNLQQLQDTRCWGGDPNEPAKAEELTFAEKVLPLLGKLKTQASDIRKATAQLAEDPIAKIRLLYPGVDPLKGDPGMCQHYKVYGAFVQSLRDHDRQGPRL